MGFKDRIKSVRGDLTQKEFADTIGVHENTVQLYENGNIPKGDILLRIHKEFDIDINWLLTGEGKQYPVSEINIGGYVREPVVEYKTADDPFARSVSGLRQIFDSQDQALIAAIQINIQAFQLSIHKDRQMEQQSIEIDPLKKECAELKERITSLEEQRDVTDIGPAAEDVTGSKAT